MRLFAFPLLLAVLATPAAAQEVPAAQARFIAVNQAVSALLADAGNPTAASLVSALSRRSSALCEMAQDGRISNWLGVVAQSDIEAGVLIISVGPEATIKVVELPAEGALRDSLATLAEGEEVLVSGRFVVEGADSDRVHCFRQEGGLTVAALRQPQFEFRVSSVVPLEVQD